MQASGSHARDTVMHGAESIEVGTYCFQTLRLGGSTQNIAWDCTNVLPCATPAQAGVLLALAVCRWAAFCFWKLLQKSSKLDGALFRGSRLREGALLFI